jgi:hypothetical protein
MRSCIFQQIVCIPGTDVSLMDMKSKKLPVISARFIWQAIDFRHQNSTAKYIVKGNSPMNFRIFFRACYLCICFWCAI